MADPGQVGDSSQREPIVIHLECGLKALLTFNPNCLTYWRRFSNTTGTYVEVGGPL